MPIIPETTRRALLLNPGDLITRDPDTGETDAWSVVHPPAQEGDHVWITTRNLATQAPELFVVDRDTELEVTDGKRAKQIAGIRALADFLDAHPDVPANALRIHYYPSNADGFEDKAAEIAEVNRVAEILGVEAGPHYKGDPHHYATRSFGPRVTYEAVVWSVYDQPAPADAAPVESEASE